MPKIAISVHNLSKSYSLGAIGARTLHADVSRWLAKVRGKQDPNLKIGQTRPGSNGQKFLALNDVTFEVPSGQILGIIGRNGAGKSTLLKVLSRVTAPTSGEARIRGRIASLLEVGTGFHPELTGRENIFLNGAILGMTKMEIKRKFDEIVDFSGVAQFIDTPVKRYSSGMYVRLAFAVAAHLEPEILIVDEVLAVGDAEFQKKCLGKMQEISKSEGRTVLFVSHNMGAIANLCTQALYLKQGTIEHHGDTATTLEKYLTSPTNHSPTERLDAFRLSNPGGARITSLSVSGKSGARLYWGEPMLVNIAVEGDHKLDGLSFGVSILNQKGETVGNCIFQDHFVLDRCEKAKFRLVIATQNLVPGVYALNVGLGLPSRLIDAIMGFPSFEIAPISQEGTGLDRWNAAWGSIYFRKLEFERVG